MNGYVNLAKTDGRTVEGKVKGHNIIEETTNAGFRVSGSIYMEDGEILHYNWARFDVHCITPDEIKEINIGIGKVIAGVK